MHGRPLSRPAAATGDAPADAISDDGALGLGHRAADGHAAGRRPCEEGGVAVAEDDRAGGAGSGAGSGAGGGGGGGGGSA